MPSGENEPRPSRARVRLQAFVRRLRAFKDRAVMRLREAFVRFLRFARLEDVHAVHAVNTHRAGLLYRVWYNVRRVLKAVVLSLWALLRILVPIVLPVAAVALVVVAVLLCVRYTVALRVVVDDEPLDVYVKDERVFDEVRDRLTAACYENNNEEYYIDFYPTLRLAVVERDRLATEEEIFTAVYGAVEDDLGQSYAVWLNGTLLGTLKRESEAIDLQRTVAAAYVDDVDVKDWSFVDDFTYTKGQYGKDNATTEEALLKLFTKPVQSMFHQVKEGETALGVAQAYGLSVPTLRLLNPDRDLSALKKGMMLQVGAPACKVSVMQTATVRFNRITPYSTVSTATSSLFEGESRVKVKGVNGLYEVTVGVTYVNGVETSRVEMSSTKLRSMVTQQVLVGSKTVAPSGEFLWPLASYYRITSYYGYRTVSGVPGFHKGLDIAAAKGTKIYAADDGVVLDSGWQDAGLGYFVKIDHGNGIVSVYGHCNKIVKGIKKGVKVTKGQLIAYVGSTGNSTGSHLHFALYYKSSKEYFNPLPYLKEKH